MSASQDTLLAAVQALGRALQDTDLPAPEQAGTLRALADAIDASGAPPRCTIVRPAPGRRPTDEISSPGQGSSDAVMVRLGDGGRRNTATILVDVDSLPPDATVEARLRIDDHLPDQADDQVFRCRVEVDPQTRRQRIDIDPDTALSGIDLGFRAGFLRRVGVDVTVHHRDRLLAADRTHLDLCDVGELGGLYRRILDRVLVVDTARQAREAGVPDPGIDYHPWFPVLNIGIDKAALYTEALIADIVDKSHFLSDPGWLLRVGIYLELLTCIGIAEAVRADVGDVLAEEERTAYDTSPVYAQIRARVDPQAWREVWALRSIAFPRLGLPRTGPVSASNLLAKRRATLAFLHAHHEDLKHAIHLAGTNHHDSQETWHRVFRDAERAVMRQTASSFPELAYLPATMRELVLWQRRGLAEQQGLYATACVQYRASMNDVAAWAREQGLMDHTGAECVAKSDSLLEAHFHDAARVATLQRADGYGPSLEFTPLRDEAAPTVAEIEELVGSAPIFSRLSTTESAELARTARPVPLAPHERFVRHGDSGTSLFIVAAGLVEVMLRSADGEDVYVEPMGPGEIVGEMSFLTGQPRAATVRAGTDGALVFEVTREAFDDLARNHPAWRTDLEALMGERLRRRDRILLDRQARRRLVGRLRALATPPWRTR